MPLVAPLPEDHNPDLTDLIQFFRGPLGVVPNSVLTMQRRPAIARAFTDLNKAVMENGGRVTAEQKRLIGYVASHAAGCRYCEAHTILAAERFGASLERLRDIWEYQTSPHFSDAERAAFDFALAAACVPNAVTLEIQTALRQHWNDDEIVEIVGVIALFGFLNRWNDSMATTLEDIGIQAGNRNLNHTGWQIAKHGL
ncbi:MAG: carboxymuconolactone decarboxylase family protein [Ferrovibrio sp.]|uniref:carboxymuconolactone decarboxylase family protein n=1 Tax=Ferrovibrio sp. TaxID=1917215 RepID=UPI002628186F|nr:carboxymuconolactone decarboxylase family protein [Ferrovibrio sp.]MCW0234220.1 carboxymuconolactone decarboxylase family protein [Ferrovibrio sp.]